MREAIIAAEVISLILCGMLIYGNAFESKIKSKRTKAFSYMVIANMAAMLADMISWISDARDELENFTYSMTFLSMVGSFVVATFFIKYLYEYVSEKRKISRTIFEIGEIYSVALILIVIISCARGHIFSIVDGEYVEGARYGIYLLANAIMLVGGLLIILYSSKALGLHDTIASLSFIVIPLIDVVINAKYEGFSMAYPAISISLFMVYIMLQSENESKLITRERNTFHQAHHDELTGLLNRRAFTDYCDNSIGSASIGVVFCDVNGLKVTNDNYGHAAGDKLLSEFAHVLQAFFRKEEVFRISGDEFVALVPDIEQSALENRMNELKNTLSSYKIPLAAVGFSFGIKSDVNKLVHEAEDNMYQEKQIFYEAYPEYKR